VNPASKSAVNPANKLAVISADTSAVNPANKYAVNPANKSAVERAYKSAVNPANNSETNSLGSHHEAIWFISNIFNIVAAISAKVLTPLPLLGLAGIIKFYVSF